MARLKAIIDSHLERYLSRRLLVWLTSTGFLIANKIDGEQWITVSLIYIGLLGLAEIAAKYKGAGNKVE